MRDRINVPITRAVILLHADRLRRAATLLERRAMRVRDEAAPAHADALREARAMVRAVVTDEAPHDPS